jgi:hypothetical protein
MVQIEERNYSGFLCTHTRTIPDQLHLVGNSYTRVGALAGYILKELLPMVLIETDLAKEIIP